MVDAAAFSSAEVALVQSRHCGSEFPTLAAAAHRSLSSDTVNVVNDLLDKAQTQLYETRHAGPNAAFGDQLAKDRKVLETSQSDRAEFSPALAAEKADLPVTVKSVPAVDASRVASRSSARKEGGGGASIRVWWSAETDLFTVSCDCRFWYADDDRP